MAIAALMILGGAGALALMVFRRRRDAAMRRSLSDTGVSRLPLPPISLRSELPTEPIDAELVDLLGEQGSHEVLGEERAREERTQELISQIADRD